MRLRLGERRDGSGSDVGTNAINGASLPKVCIASSAGPQRMGYRVRPSPSLLVQAWYCRAWRSWGKALSRHGGRGDLASTTDAVFVKGHEDRSTGLHPFAQPCVWALVRNASVNAATRLHFAIRLPSDLGADRVF